MFPICDSSSVFDYNSDQKSSIISGFSLLETADVLENMEKNKKKLGEIAQ